MKVGMLEKGNMALQEAEDWRGAAFQSSVKEITRKAHHVPTVHKSRHFHYRSTHDKAFKDISVLHAHIFEHFSDLMQACAFLAKDVSRNLFHALYPVLEIQCHYQACFITVATSTAISRYRGSQTHDYPIRCQFLSLVLAFM